MCPVALPDGDILYPSPQALEKLSKSQLLEWIKTGKLRKLENSLNMFPPPAGYLFLPSQLTSISFLAQQETLH